MEVWVLDIEGYDAFGGSALVFSTPELAMAARPDVPWGEPDADGEWYAQGWSIYKRVVDEA